MPNDRRKDASAGSKTAFHFLAGLGSGTLTAILLQPADLLKTRLQQSTNKNVANPLLHAFREVAASPQGIRTLWRGTVPSAWRTGLGSALYFGSLNVMRSRLAAAGVGTESDTRRGDRGRSSSSALPKLDKTTNLLTGAVARAGAGFIMMPITVIKVRYESSFYNYGSLVAAGRDILRSEGFRGFFAGFGATAVRDAPYAGLYVLFYEESKRRLASITTQSSSTSSSVGINFLSGVLAAGTATALTNPFDAIKTRLQLMPAKYSNMFIAGRVMVFEDGWRSLFDGLGLRMARKAMSSALAWTVYEELIRRAELRWVGSAKQEDLV